MKTQSQGTSIPEEVPEEYGNDTFESLDSTVTPTHSTPVRSDLSFKRDSSPSVSRRSSNDGSKSEEEASMTGESQTVNKNFWGFSCFKLSLCQGFIMPPYYSQI